MGSHCQKLCPDLNKRTPTLSFLSDIEGEELPPGSEERNPLLAAGEWGCHSNELLPKSTHYMVFESDFLLCIHLAAPFPVLPSTHPLGLLPSLQDLSLGWNSIYLVCLCRRKGVAFHGPRVGSCLTPGNEWSEETQADQPRDFTGRSAGRRAGE